MNLSPAPRLWLFAGLALAALAQLWLVRHEGWVAAWTRWHVPARSPHFSDLRVITGASDSVERGLDPREENPGAPFGQRFNQTRVWLWLGDLGVRERDSTAVGLVLLAGYALGVWLLAQGSDARTAGLFVPLLFSPAALLAVERGTTDLSVFALLALAGWLAGRAVRGALAAVLAAFVLKLFPLAGVVLVWREPRRRAWRLGLLVLVVAAVFCALNFRELVDIAYKTEKGRDHSYGWAVLSLYLGQFPGRAASLAPAVRWLGGGLALAGFALAAWRGRAVPEEAPPSTALDFFRIGAAVYAGTFALGASWDYRLIFGLFLIPQLAAWTRDGDRALRRTAIAVLAALFVAAWSAAGNDWLGGPGAGTVTARIIEELSKWLLFFGCGHLLARTMPAWLKRAPGVSPRGAA